MLKRIHVNMHVIRRNLKSGEREPPLSLKSARGNMRAMRIEIDGPSTVIYSPDKPLACGARVWIETSAPARLMTDSCETRLD